LNSRVVLSPFAAKRLSMLLDSVIKQHATRFGTRDVGVIQEQGVGSNYIFLPNEEKG